VLAFGSLMTCKEVRYTWTLVCLAII